MRLTVPALFSAGSLMQEAQMGDCATGMVIKESTLVYAEAVLPEHVSTWAEAATENETTNLGSGGTEVCKRNRNSA